MISRHCAACEQDLLNMAYNLIHLPADMLAILNQALIDVVDVPADCLRE